MKKYLSPAKINLFLHITGKRVDGYHNLETIFVLLDLFDEIFIEVNSTGKITRKGKNDNILPNDDLILKAAKLLQKTSNSKFGAEIKINKKIPIGGGLGGGSSNAATVLLALNKLWNLNLSNQQLQKIGLELGADVPVFIFQNHAFATGVGEVLTKIEAPKYYYLLLHPKTHTSTKEIFNSPKLTFSQNLEQIPDFKKALNFKNDCLNATLNSSPLIQDAIDFLEQLPNKIGEAKLSGTGSCVFAVFSNLENARNSLEKFRNKKFTNIAGFLCMANNIL